MSDLAAATLRGWTSHFTGGDPFESFGGSSKKGSKGDKTKKSPQHEHDTLDALKTNDADDETLMGMMNDPLGEFSLGLDFGFGGGEDELDQVLGVRDRDQDLDNGSTKEPSDDKDVYDFIGGELDKELEKVSYDDVEEFL